MRLMRLFILYLLIGVLFFSCSKSEPVIHFGFMELIYYPGRTRPEERYSFFILPDDDDGIDNLSELYLYNDREGLRWLFTSEDWIIHEESGQTWIGSRNIAMYDDAPLPRGQYRAVLINKGGESTERKFTFDGPEIPPYPFPVFSIEGGAYRIESQYPLSNLLCYDQQGKLVQTIPVKEHTGNVRELRLTASARTIALWAEEPEYLTSVVTEAVPIR
jgi:hypothetical protein